jgi:hypothetical protein
MSILEGYQGGVIFGKLAALSIYLFRPELSCFIIPVVIEYTNSPILLDLADRKAIIER